MGDAYPSREQQDPHHRSPACGRGALLRNLGHGHGNPGRRRIGQRVPGAAGRVAFKLHDTYGFPLDLTNDVCREAWPDGGRSGLHAAMEQQRPKAAPRASSRWTRRWNTTARATPSATTTSRKLQNRVALYADGTPVATLKAGQPGWWCWRPRRSMPMGGQVGDQGPSSATAACSRWKTRKDQGGRVWPPRRAAKAASGRGRCRHCPCGRRWRCARPPATTGHPPHAQGPARGAGRACAAEGQPGQCRAHRADFAHNAPVTDEQIRQIETLVNAEVLANAAARARDGHRSPPEDRRDDAVWREIR